MEEDDSQCTCRFTLEEIMSMPPLGFRSVATEPFRKLVESTLSKSAADNVGVGYQNDKDKMKASHFPITTFSVGNWKRESTRKGDLTAKIYYGRKKLVWEFLNGPLKSKMEVCWSDITAIEAVMNPNQPEFLRVELAKPPLFFREIPPQPRKHSNWEPVDDFTDGQAQLCRKHEAMFPPGVLDKHYEKLLINDGCLAELSRRPFSTNESVFPWQQIPKQQLLSSVLPLQHIPQQQFHHSLDSNIIAASASSNGGMAAWGNHINNKPTFVDSSRQNHPLVLDQPLYQYNDITVNNEPTFVVSSIQKPVPVPASTFVDSSRQNRHLVLDQRLYQYNDMANNNGPAFVDRSTSSENSSAVTDQQQLSPRSSWPPWCMRRGNDEEQYMVQNAPTADELGLAEAILREADAKCDDGAWSLLDLYIMQSQEDHCNQPVGGGDANEASSVSPASPPSKP